MPYEFRTSACRTDTWFKRRRVALAPIPCRRIKEVMGPMTSIFIHRTSRLLLIRFQQTTTSSVGECLARRFPRPCAISSRSLPAKKLARTIWPHAAGLMVSCVHDAGIRREPARAGSRARTRRIRPPDRPWLARWASLRRPLQPTQPASQGRATGSTKSGKAVGRELESHHSSRPAARSHENSRRL